MKIIYGYSNCSDKEYHKLLQNSPIPVLQPDQKYHGLLIKGLAKNVDKVICLSGLPMNHKSYQKIFIHEQDEEIDNIYYHYYHSINLPIIRQFCIFNKALWNTLLIKKEKDTYAICDCLNIANAYGIAIGCHLRHIPISFIVTDLPDMMSKNKMIRYMNNHLFHKADGFILLTEQMNQRINKKHKPYIIMEGHVDSGMAHNKALTSYEASIGKKVILYAGSLLKLYGIANLVEGFIKADIKDSELHIYGDGDYKEELINVCKTHSNIIYYGNKANNEVVEEELKASLLVNPRPSEEEYTQYSFPSKNMEYMVSGTPTMTTKLPGMPEEYYPYVKFIEDETINGIANALISFFNLPLQDREAFGQKAKAFVLDHKSNIIQGRRIVQWLHQEI